MADIFAKVLCDGVLVGAPDNIKAGMIGEVVRLTERDVDIRFPDTSKPNTAWNFPRNKVELNPLQKSNAYLISPRTSRNKVLEIMLLALGFWPTTRTTPEGGTKEVFVWGDDCEIVVDLDEDFDAGEIVGQIKKVWMRWGSEETKAEITRVMRYFRE